MESLQTDYIYRKIAGNLEKKILDGVLKTGNKLPSLRTISNEYGVSISSILQAYYMLESKGLIEARPQSGYFVTYCNKLFPNIIATSKPNKIIEPDETENIISKVYSEIGKHENLSLSLGVPAIELLPVAKLNKSLIQATREYKNPQPSLNL